MACSSVTVLSVQLAVDDGSRSGPAAVSSHRFTKRPSRALSAHLTCGRIVSRYRSGFSTGEESPAADGYITSLQCATATVYVTMDADSCHSWTWTRLASDRPTRCSVLARIARTPMPRAVKMCDGARLKRLRAAKKGSLSWPLPRCRQLGRQWPRVHSPQEARRQGATALFVLASRRAQVYSGSAQRGARLDGTTGTILVGLVVIVVSFRETTCLRTRRHRLYLWGRLRSWRGCLRMVLSPVVVERALRAVSGREVRSLSFTMCIAAGKLATNRTAKFLAQSPVRAGAKEKEMGHVLPCRPKLVLSVIYGG
jgi:hypothetical protein